MKKEQKIKQIDIIKKRNWQEKSYWLNDKEEKLLSNDKGQITTSKSF